VSEIESNPQQSGGALAARLRALTPARVGLGRTGVSLETRELLDFQRAHAQARDAVHSRLDAAALAVELERATGLEVLRLRSACADRATYLQRPDLGRRLDEASRALLAGRGEGSDHREADCELTVIVADGLSALAVERHALPFLGELLPRLSGWAIGPVVVVEQGRVAISDEIGLALRAQISVVLIGERPGLSSPDSLGAYITWGPQAGRTDAERNCISNIRADGLSYKQAAEQLWSYLVAARERRLTGVRLKLESGAELLESGKESQEFGMERLTGK
jgi:ethanolamine ammonia-lyase small subunit